MAVPKAVLKAEIKARVARTQQAMRERGYDLLIVYGDNKVYGSLRYLTDYFPDRAGWISLTPSESRIVEGAAVVMSLRDDPVLLVDPGLMPTRELCVDRVIGGAGFSAKKGDGLSAPNLARLIADVGSVSRIGIETWDKFPLPLYLELKPLVPAVEFERSTIVEDLRLIKSPFEIEMVRQAALVADLGHQTVTDYLKSGVGKTELEIIRAAEHAMRSADPIYEDSCSSSPSLICSGFPVGGALLHLPDGSKRIARGNVVHWDICMRFEGAPIDSARTRVMGNATDQQVRAYDAVLRMHEAVMQAAKPGVPANRLVELAAEIARNEGYDLWNDFVGHGLGLDLHERPDMGMEETPLAANMLITVEPRIAIDNMYLVGNEDMVWVTEEGGKPLTHFPKTPLAL
jgi:Xaa-Pro aminopeptidase